ncbi:hypothetical protein TNCV_543491 [Trichonephila clavipes]|nr:hypothetical protein TNCV_543491 [Trichonephila clavipes]
MNTPLSWSGLSQGKRVGTLTTDKAGEEARVPLQSHGVSRQDVPHRLFSTSKVRGLLNSSSTGEESLTVRHSKTNSGPSRTKDRSCSQRTWFCFIITSVHTSRGHTCGTGQVQVAAA